MRLDKLTADVRPISSDEAIELGMAMARAWFGRLFGFYLGRAMVMSVILIPISMAIAYWQKSQFDYDEISLWFWGMMYFLKPLFEINVLLFLSRRLFDGEFDEDLTYKITPKVFFDLCVRYRLSLQRPVVMAVYLLEGQRGKALTSRLSALSRGRNNALGRHTLAFFVAEWFLYFAGFFLIGQTFEHVHPQLSNGWLDNGGLWADIIANLIGLLTQAMIAVFFVASGFSLYVCQRSLLEGWDIELGFRRLVGRFLTQKNHQEDA